MMKCGIADNHDQGSDHLPVETILTGELQRLSETPSFNYDKAGWETFNKTLQEQLPLVPHAHTLWSPVAIDGYTEQLTTTLTKAVEKSTPYRNPCPDSKRWWSPEVLALRRQQNRQRNLYRRTRSPIDLAAWEERAREYSEGITRAQKDKWKEYIQAADRKSIWQIKKYATNIATSSLIPTLDDHAATHEDKVETLTRTFFLPPPPADLTNIAQSNRDFPLPVPYQPSITIEQIPAAV